MIVSSRCVRRRRFVASVFLSCCAFASGHCHAEGATIRGRIIDAESDRAIPARLYLVDADGEFFFCESDASEGSALAYCEEWVPLPGSVERHTTISGHPFRYQVPVGTYQLTVVRGKEYHIAERTITVDREDQDVTLTIPLQRWIDMPSRGWYSGETHVHRRLEELPNVMNAEDLHVAFPVAFWTTVAEQVPNLAPSNLRRQGPSPWGARTDAGYEPILIGSARVIFPRNTEYEIFSVAGQRHVLGALFVLNHQSVFRQSAPPIRKIAELAHREGAMLDLDKHNWPWSMMLVSVAKVDLFELSNNSVWRTNFGFRQTPVEPASYMQVERDEQGLSEWGWLTFGFESYYTLLNCGFHLQPTAGTASGVHPVPLGYSRVYVHVDRFEPQAWLDSLRQGRSFVTTGPMLLATINDKLPGEVFQEKDSNGQTFTLDVNAVSTRPLERVEVICEGRVVARVAPRDADSHRLNDRRAYELRHRWNITQSQSQSPTDQPAASDAHAVTIPGDRSTWLVVRAIERQPGGRIRFAHSAPWHWQVPGKPVLPRLEEVDYLIDLMRQEIARNRPILSVEALAEFEQAEANYQKLRAQVRAASQFSK